VHGLTRTSCLTPSSQCLSRAQLPRNFLIPLTVPWDEALTKASEQLAARLFEVRHFSLIVKQAMQPSAWRTTSAVPLATAQARLCFQARQYNLAFSPTRIPLSVSSWLRSGALGTRISRDDRCCKLACSMHANKLPGNRSCAAQERDLPEGCATSTFGSGHRPA